jgi:hypothetical protein
MTSATTTATLFDTVVQRAAKATAVDKAGGKALAAGLELRDVVQKVEAQHAQNKKHVNDLSTLCWNFLAY